ncbi:glycosyltransferase [Belliella kenyensis]|uniref:Glycosyltransferase n=1 Tax=Belliella kenyensis TaxID=1472724 RepID=A0ABV8EKE6_9BACT|nr:glycosyltransferase [Belliella kenyensis]MCH7402645.1 glycosyltransferase [Belliella kenyensis]MDN3603807.1 glycosyltransferase [Belliella kenyensis]
MKIVHVQYGASSSGNYTITLHKLMKSNGVDSSVLALFSNFVPDDPKIQFFGKLPNLKSRLDHKLQARLNKENNKEFGNFSYPKFGTDISGHPLVKHADIIYIHWALGGFLNLKSFKKIAELGKPVVFVIHDMWIFTGGCHYSFECDNFKTFCRSCQVLPNPSDFDRSSKLFAKKEQFFNSFENLFFVSPSKWMEKNAKSSALLKGKSITQIYNSVSENFQEMPSKSEKFIKRSNKKIIGFGANYISSPYKGFKYLLEALQHLGNRGLNEKYEILVFGSNLSDEVIDKIPFKVHYTGYLSNENDICEAYNSMDVFVVSSVADNLPTTVLESLRCGTAVVGFETGGIPEMVEHKMNGYLAKSLSSEDLADGISYCLEEGLRGKLKAEFADEAIMQSHLDLFASLKHK